ncbi:hypothetical protein CHKEEEPN_2585 [Methylorubrum podarium]|nr:hypothetical protein CHKEEEPN_2585 [Methylorubrum podarium]
MQVDPLPPVGTLQRRPRHGAVLRDDVAEDGFDVPTRGQPVVAEDRVVARGATRRARHEVDLPITHLGGLQGQSEVVARELQLGPARLALVGGGLGPGVEEVDLAQIDPEHDQPGHERFQPSDEPADRAARRARQGDHVVEHQQQQRDGQPELKHGAQPRRPAQDRERGHRQGHHDGSDAGGGQEPVIVALDALRQQVDVARRCEAGEHDRDRGGRRGEPADARGAPRRDGPAAPVALHDGVGQREQRRSDVPEGPEPGRGVGPVAEQAARREDVGERQELKQDDQRHVEAAGAENEQRNRARVQVLGEEQVGGQRVDHGEGRLVDGHEARHRRHRMARNRQQRERDGAEGEADDAGETPLCRIGPRRRQGRERRVRVDRGHRVLPQRGARPGRFGQSCARRTA